MPQPLDSIDIIDFLMFLSMDSRDLLDSAGMNWKHVLRDARRLRRIGREEFLADILFDVPGDRVAEWTSYTDELAAFLAKQTENKTTGDTMTPKSLYLCLGSDGFRDFVRDGVQFCITNDPARALRTYDGRGGSVPRIASPVDITDCVVQADMGAYWILDEMGLIEHD